MADKPIENFQYKPPDHEESAIYPDLRDKINSREFRLRANLWSIFGQGKIVKPLMNELRNATVNGKITSTFYLDEKNGGPGEYEIKLSRKDAESYVSAAEKFLSHPLTFDMLSEAMPPELESLLTGGEPDKYTRLGDIKEE